MKHMVFRVFKREVWKENNYGEYNIEAKPKFSQYKLSGVSHKNMFLFYFD